MAQSTLQRALVLLRTSVRGQLLLVACSSVLLGLTVRVPAGATTTFAAATAVTLLSFAMSARIGVRGLRGYDTRASDLPGDVAQLAPRVLAHSLQVLLPAAGVTWLALQVASMNPFLGIVAIVVVLVASLVLPAPLLLAVAGVASGDRRWSPTHSLSMVGARPVQTCGGAIVGLPCAGIVSLPLVVVSLVLGSLVGPASFAAWGLALSAVVPFVGCGSLAAWQVLGGDELLAADAAASEGRVDAAAPPAPGAAAGSPAQSAIAGAADAPVTWVDGPSWDVALDAGALWGTWVRMPAPARVAIRVTWHAGPVPELSMSSADGAWWRPGDPNRSGEPVIVDLPSGDTYVQLGSRSTVAQAVSTTLLVPAAAAA